MEEIPKETRKNITCTCPFDCASCGNTVFASCLPPDLTGSREDLLALTTPLTATSPTTSITPASIITPTTPSTPPTPSTTTATTPVSAATPSTTTTPSTTINPTTPTTPIASVTTTVATSAASQIQPRVGLDGVVVTQTRLSLVDGKNGVLVIGGYFVEEIADRISLEEAALLLWTGELPSAAATLAFRKELALVGCHALRAETLAIIRAARDAPPIDALRMACATLSLDVSDPSDISPAGDLALAKYLLACFPTVVAAHSRIRGGMEPIAPRADLSLAANFLYMVFGTEPDQRAMNASTFAARVIASTRSDMVSAVTGAVGALKGPLHGGAPGPVLDMLVEMKTADAAESWLRREMGEGRRIMGFGHRIYKVRDPRAEVLAKAADEMAGASVESAELYSLACAVEKTALRVLEELKPGRNLKTNVEFYTALVLQSLGLQSDQFVSVFACGRVVGWCAHVREQHEQDHLIRPQSEYVGLRRSWDEK